MARTSLDSFDLKILDVWQRNGDAGPQEMSEIVHLSPSQCSRRMANLRANGHIHHVAAVLNPGPLNIGVQAYVMVAFNSHGPQRIADFIAHIVEQDEVQECQALTGSSDIMLKIATKDLNSLNAFLSKRLLAAPEVATTRSSIVLQTFKSSTRLPMRFAEE